MEAQDLVDTVETIHAGGMSIIWIEAGSTCSCPTVDRMLALHDRRKIIEGEPRDVMASVEIRDDTL